LGIRGKKVINNKKVLAVIPARAGSKSIPKKNIHLLGGKPLIAYSIKAARDSQYIDRIIVSTDSKEIAKVAKKFCAEIPFLRPARYAEDSTPDFPVFKHCLDWLKKKEGYVPEIIVHLRPTGPLRTGAEIDDAIEHFEKHILADSLRSVEEPPKSPYKMWRPKGVWIKPFVEDFPKLKDYHTAARQILPKVYQTTADIGICRLRTIQEKKSIIGNKVLYYLLKRPTVDIDNIFDFEIAEFLLKNENK
jgi:N-acylneuraminate cytidylyltransferase